MPESDETDLGNVTRRACLRLAILAATGLAFLPACSRSRGTVTAAGTTSSAPATMPPASTASAAETGGGSLLDRWARLGRIWRAMSAQLRVPPGGQAAARQAFEGLKADMAAALDALPASPALRALFEERWQHIFMLQYGGMCYGPPGPGAPVFAMGHVEQQVEELNHLVAQGRLTRAAGVKAARTLAVQAEYLTRGREANEDAHRGQTFLKLKVIGDAYQAGKITPSAASGLAGQRVTELTADKLGMLAGPPKENEGEKAPEQGDKR